ncbi:hypothetical protein Ocin01_06833, partial [Orchesella cincta]
ALFFSPEKCSKYVLGGLGALILGLGCCSWLSVPTETEINPTNQGAQIEILFGILIKSAVLSYTMLCPLVYFQSYISEVDPRSITKDLQLTLDIYGFIT